MEPPVTCLLVDDLEENLLVLSALLRRDDIALLTATSGAEALELLLVHDVALALIDVHMPDMDGFELAELMRGTERTRHVPIIFVTAAVREPHRQFKGYSTGAVDFLYKPIDALALESKTNVFFDLARQKRRLADEYRRQSETLRLNEMFTAVLGHDLRNPLNAIVTGAHLLQQRSAEPELRHIASRILTSGRRMSRMIEDLLDLTRARLAGGIPLTVGDVDLEGVVDRVVQELRTAHPTRTIELQATGDLRGAWDADRLQQVASNLIANALQHGAGGGGIRVHVDGTGPEVSLSVTNDGAIRADVRDALFDPFRSGSRHSGRGDGLGLGLFIAQQLAHAHHGRIAVESGDATTTFTVTLPRAAVHTPAT